MAMDEEKALKALSPKRVWLSVAIGLAVVVFVAARDKNLTKESFFLMAEVSVSAIIIALLVLAVKDGLNTIRIKVLGEGAFSWKSALFIVLLWEFSTAVTPPLFGPMGLVIFVLYKEGVSLGKAFAYAMLLAFFDNLFFLTAAPLAYFVSAGAVLPSSEGSLNELGSGIDYFFYLSYGLVAYYTCFIAAAILFFPNLILRMLLWIASLKLMKRGRLVLSSRANELYAASQEFRGKHIGYWLKLLCLTYSVWIMKYLVINVLVSGFVALSLEQHLLMVGRHLVMWLVMLVSPTPGSAGTAEYLFPAFFAEFLGDYTFAGGLIWRLLSFYPYLIIGALILPNWIKRVLVKSS